MGALSEGMQELHEAAEPIRVEVRAFRDAVGGWGVRQVVRLLRALGIRA